MTTRRRLVAAALALPVAGYSMQTQAQDATPVAATESAIAYADRDGTPLPLDVFLPTAGDPPFPAVLLFHGGAWTYGISGPMDMAGPAAAIAAAGHAAFNVSYRLTGDPAGAHVWPDQLDDAQQAVRWVGQMLSNTGSIRTGSPPTVTRRAGTSPRSSASAKPGTTAQRNWQGYPAGSTGSSPSPGRRTSGSLTPRSSTGRPLPRCSAARSTRYRTCGPKPHRSPGWTAKAPHSSSSMAAQTPFHRSRRGR